MPKPMEICKEIRSTAPPRKRKAEDSSDDIEDDGNIDEEQGGDEEESDVSSREEGQEWDVDSFDDGFDYRPKRNLDPNDELGQKMHRYRSQMYRSKGFHVDRENDPGNVMYRPLGPIDDLDQPFMTTGLTCRDFMQTMVDLSLERLNKIKGSTVTSEYIVRVVMASVSGIKSYITFMAREFPDGDLVEYQAKTEQRVWQKKPHVIFCRPAPKLRDEDDFVYTDTSSEEEDSDLSSRESDQEWDVDSLDEPDYKLPRVHIPIDEEVEKMRLYRPQMYKSKGFNVDGERYSGLMCYFSPVDLDNEIKPFQKITGREYMQKMVDLALESYNKIKGSTVTCDHIVRANLTKVGGHKSYITFMAREVPGGDLVEYQAKTEKKFSQRKVHVIFCRPSPKSKDQVGSTSAEENTTMTKPMELCEEIRSTASPRKRKAEDSSDDIEDDGMVDEEQGGDEDESDASSREEGQEWDVDSFDDGFDYRPKRNLDPNDELGQKMHRYRSQMYRSKGFLVDRENDPGNVIYRPLGPIDDLDQPYKTTGLTYRAFMQTMVDFSLKRLNKIKGSTVTSAYIVRVVVAKVSGLKSYITFMAREFPGGDLVEYQAKTEQRVWQKKPHVIFCRPAPKLRDEDDFVYTDSSSDEEDSDLSSRESDQEWDVDSLDEEPDYKLPRVHIPIDEEVEKMRLYRPQMYKSKGFNVDGERYPGLMCYFSPVDLDSEIMPFQKITGREYMQKMVDLALESYNKIKGSTVTCDHIVRANLTKVGGHKSYITFMAREVPGGDLVEYQAKTEKKFSQRKVHVIFCRPSPKSKD